MTTIPNTDYNGIEPQHNIINTLQTLIMTERRNSLQCRDDVMLCLNTIVNRVWNCCHASTLHQFHFFKTFLYLYSIVLELSVPVMGCCHINYYTIQLQLAYVLKVTDVSVV